jgi:hypothetical protein
MATGWGRFTARGSRAVEERITAAMERAAHAASAVLAPSEYRALVLIGGYGRGEGGVEVREGAEYPHNNFDLVLITNDLSSAAQTGARRRLREAVLPLSEEYGIEVDVSTTTVSRLQHTPALVIWYDMRFGHKTILGDAGFVPSLAHLRLERIPASDVRNLLVNRGTLLIINALVLEQQVPDEPVRRLVVKHIMKAIIGYGDALLFFLGHYHWSYREKQRRMQTCTEAPESFRALYDEAVEFRFQPRYAGYLCRDLAAWQAELRAALAPVHLECERRRLQCAGLRWEDYPETALRHGVFEETASPRALAKKAANFLRGAGLAAPLSYGAVLGYRMLGPAGVLPIVFPVPAYELEEPRLRQFAAAALGARHDSIPELRRAFLRFWGQRVDTNFGSVMRKWHIDLDSEAHER